MRIVLILVLGAGIAGGVYWFTLPECKRPGAHDAAAPSSATPASAPVASSAQH